MVVPWRSRRNALTAGQGGQYRRGLFLPFSSLASLFFAGFFQSPTCPNVQSDQINSGPYVRLGSIRGTRDSGFHRVPLGRWGVELVFPFAPKSNGHVDASGDLCVVNVFVRLDGSVIMFNLCALCAFRGQDS